MFRHVRLPCLLTAIGLMVVVLGQGVGCVGPPTPTSQPDDPNDSNVRVGAVGDSITQANSPDFDQGRFGDQSWLHYVIDTDQSFAGGWAQWGATTEQMAEHTPRFQTDILIIMAGTNDLALGVGFSEIASNLRDIADQVDSKQTILASIPPLDHDPEASKEFNVLLKELAHDQHWIWVDASEGIRGSDGRFLPGMSYDGVHPSADGAAHIGSRLLKAVNKVA